AGLHDAPGAAFDERAQSEQRQDEDGGRPAQRPQGQQKQAEGADRAAAQLEREDERSAQGELELRMDRVEPDLLGERGEDQDEECGDKSGARTQPGVAAGEQQDGRTALEDQRHGESDPRDLLDRDEVPGQHAGGVGDDVEIAAPDDEQRLVPRPPGAEPEKEPALLGPQPALQRDDREPGADQDDEGREIEDALRRGRLAADQEAQASEPARGGGDRGEHAPPSYRRPTGAANGCGRSRGVPSWAPAGAPL